MRIKLLCLCGAILLGSFALTACTQSGNETTTGEPQTAGVVQQNPSDTVTTAPQTRPTGEMTGSEEPFYTLDTVDEENIFDFVVLGQYTGIEYIPVAPDAVTDAEVNAVISDHLGYGSEKTEITDRAAVIGDSVTIDFQGLISGTPFEGGSAENIDFEIGSGQFIPGFEEQLVGHKAGETFEIDVTFPTDYHMTDLAGQPAVFNINLKSIFTKTIPELTDEFVSEQLGIPTIAEYRTMIWGQLEAEKAVTADNEEKKQLWSKVVQNAAVIKYPEDEVKFRITEGMREFLEYSSAYGLELSLLVPQVTGKSLEEFIETEVNPIAVKHVAQDLVLRAIAAKEGIKLEEADIDARVVQIVATSGYESVEAFWEANNRRAVRISLLAEKVIDFIMTSAIEKNA